MPSQAEFVSRGVLSIRVFVPTHRDGNTQASGRAIHGTMAAAVPLAAGRIGTIERAAVASFIVGDET